MLRKPVKGPLPGAYHAVVKPGGASSNPHLTTLSVTMTCYAPRSRLLLPLLAILVLVVAAPSLEKLLEETSQAQQKPMGVKSQAQAIIISIALFIIVFAIFAAVVRAARRINPTRVLPAPGHQPARHARVDNAATPQIELTTRHGVGAHRDQSDPFDSTDTLNRLPIYDPDRVPPYPSKATGAAPCDIDDSSARPSTSTSTAAIPPSEEDITIQALPRAEVADRGNTPPQAVPNFGARGPL